MSAKRLDDAEASKEEEEEDTAGGQEPRLAKASILGTCTIRTLR